MRLPTTDKKTEISRKNGIIKYIQSNVWGDQLDITLGTAVAPPYFSQMTECKCGWNKEVHAIVVAMFPKPPTVMV